MSLITDSKKLKEFIAECKREEFIAVDTEFDRRNTYYPEFCLIQIATAKKAYAIEVMDDNINLKPLRSLLKNKRVVKVFHSAREDVETLYSNIGVIPRPIFDTQIAAHVLGFGETIGYGNLVEAMLGVVLDKGVQFSNWMKRPLSSRQLDYAIDDVVHLYDLYIEMTKMLANHKQKREQVWAICKKLQDKKKYQNNPKEAWKRLVSNRMSEDTVKVLKKIARWREEKAQKVNIPRQWILHNSLVKRLANIPRTKERLEEIDEIQYLLRNGRLPKSALKEISKLLGQA